jgi:putative peptidoglycan lipid II flippase
MSGLPEGSVSAYNYGYVLMQLPETLLGTAIAIVVFPTLAEYYNAGNLTALKETAMGALRVIWMLTIPAAVGLVLLGEEAIALVLQRGAFDAESTRLVYIVLLFFSIRIVSEATLEIVARLFYARHNTRTPMFLYLGWLVINVAFAALLVGPLGIGGIALASTIAFTALSAALFFLNRRELGSLGERQLALSAGRSLLAAGGMALAIVGVRLILGESFLFLVVGGALAAAVYLLLHYLLGGPELRALWGMVRPGRKPTLTAQATGESETPVT